MFEQFYGFDANPFRLSLDSQYSYEHRSYRRAKVYMKYALDRAEGFVMVTGLPGTGKTLLIRDLLKDLDPSRFLIANLICNQLEADDVLRMVAKEFDIYAFSTEKGTLLSKIKDYVIAQSMAGRQAVLIVDEAQSLPTKALEELRMLANLQTDNRALLQIFFVGQEALRKTVYSPGMEQLRQRIVATCRIEPMTVIETKEFITHRLSVVGWRDDPHLESAIFPLIHQFTEGIPRRIVHMVSRLLLFCALEQRHRVEVDDVWLVLQEMQDEQLLPFDPGMDLELMKEQYRLSKLLAEVQKLPECEGDSAAAPETGGTATATAVGADTPDSDVSWKQKAVANGIAHNIGQTEDVAEPGRTGSSQVASPQKAGTSDDDGPLTTPALAATGGDDDTILTLPAFKLDRDAGVKRPVVEDGSLAMAKDAAADLAASASSWDPGVRKEPAWTMLVDETGVAAAKERDLASREKDIWRFSEQTATAETAADPLLSISIPRDERFAPDTRPRRRWFSYTLIAALALAVMIVPQLTDVSLLWVNAKQQGNQWLALLLEKTGLDKHPLVALPQEPGVTAQPDPSQQTLSTSESAVESLSVLDQERPVVENTASGTVKAPSLTSPTAQESPALSQSTPQPSPIQEESGNQLAATSPAEVIESTPVADPVVGSGADSPPAPMQPVPTDAATADDSKDAVAETTVAVEETQAESLAANRNSVSQLPAVSVDPEQAPAEVSPSSEQTLSPTSNLTAAPASLEEPVAPAVPGVESPSEEQTHEPSSPEKDDVVVREFVFVPPETRALDVEATSHRAGGSALPVSGTQQAKPDSTDTANAVAGVATEQLPNAITQIYFEFDSVTLDPQFYDVLNSILAQLQANTQNSVSIIGFADSYGDPVYNTLLSRRRATVVARYLAEQGLEQSRIKVAGGGTVGKVKLAPDGQKVGEFKKRRVEVRVVPTASITP